MYFQFMKVEFLEVLYKEWIVDVEFNQMLNLEKLDLSGHDKN